MLDTYKKPRKKKPDLNSRVGKYYLARKNGLTKKDAQIVAGYSTPTHAPMIEDTKTYKAIEAKYYADELKDIIQLKEIASEQVKVIMQDKDLGAKNTAIKQALERLEPQEKEAEAERVVIVLK